MNRISKLSPFIWGSLVLIAGQAFVLAVSLKLMAFLEEQQITYPEVSLLPVLVYFFGAVILMGVVLLLVSVSKLKIIMRGLFALLYAWGVFIFLGLFSSYVFELLSSSIVAIVIAIVAGSAWFLRPKIWLHNLLLIITLASMGATFGLLFSPWTFIFFMLAVAVYDFLAVRFGFMQWMAGKLSESVTLPAFVFPMSLSYWNLDLKETSFSKLMETEPGERDFSILGGGDIGFPLLLAVSVLFAYGLTGSIIVALFSLLGLISAYLIQFFFLKGKPIPALPPIFLMSLIGFLIVYFVL